MGTKAAKTSKAVKPWAAVAWRARGVPCRERLRTQHPGGSSRPDTPFVPAAGQGGPDPTHAWLEAVFSVRLCDVLPAAPAPQVLGILRKNCLALTSVCAVTFGFSNSWEFCFSAAEVCSGHSSLTILMHIFKGWGAAGKWVSRSTDWPVFAHLL